MRIATSLTKLNDKFDCEGRGFAACFAEGLSPSGAQRAKKQVVRISPLDGKAQPCRKAGGRGADKLVAA
jgi:hypothetical protein